MSKEYKVRVEFKNGDIYEATLSDWLWEEVILKDISKGENVMRYSVEIKR